jgi:CRP-like cAMP-binding protein
LQLPGLSLGSLCILHRRINGNAIRALAFRGHALLSADRATIANKLLAVLSDADFALLQPHLTAVELPLRRQLEIRNRRIEHAYFIEQGLASVVISAGSNHSVEVGIIGSEGMTGLSVLLEAERALHETFIQTAGSGWRIAVGDLHRVMDASTTLRPMLLRYVHTVVSQMAFTALANARYQIEERLARWLLMAQDRMAGDTVVLTHEFLAIMLGSRRAGVTNALNEFESRGIIETRRGAISILKRGALEEAANGSYGGPESEYERLFRGEESRTLTGLAPHPPSRYPA